MSGERPPDNDAAHAADVDADEVNFTGPPIDKEEQILEDEDTTRLVAAFQEGDNEAFAGLYTRYFERVYGYLRVAFEDHHEAEDAAQQVFTQIFEALHRYERRRQPFRAWLFVIVRNYAISYLTKQGRIEVVDPAELDRLREGSDLEIEIDSDAELRTLSWITDPDMFILVERLTVAQRQVLALRFMFDFSLKQTAKVLDRTPNDVAALQHRAVVFLRTRLAALGRSPTTPGEQTMKAWLPPAQVIRRRRNSLKRQ